MGRLWTICWISIQEALVYRFDIIVGIARSLIQIYVLKYLWHALYAGSDSYFGVSVAQTVTYASMSIVINSLFSNSLISEVNSRIRSGDIVFDLARPMYYGTLLFSRTLGNSIARLFTTSIPLFLFVLCIMGIEFPTATVVWTGFAISVSLSICLAFLFDFVFSLAGFWITEMSGIVFLKRNFTDIMSGAYLPIWIFPSFIADAMLLLPFRGIHYTPLAMLVGQIQPQEIPEHLGFQVLWIFIIIAVARMIFRAVVGKLAVQGG